MKKTFIALSLLAIPTMMWAQDENEINVDAQVRTRAEYRNGYQQLRPERAQPASFIAERARLGIGYERGDGLSAKLSVQQVGVWGQYPQIDKEGRIMMNEAWGQLRFGENFFAKLGRQILSYDDERLFGELDWNMYGRSHDALKLGFENDMHKVHLILAYSQNRDSLGSTYYDARFGQPYKHMQTLWYHYGNDDNPFGASFLFANIGLEAGVGEGDTRYSQTLGTYLTYRPEKLDLQASAYYQMGKSGSGDKVSAWMASVNAGFMPTEQWKFNLGYDYLSGEDGSGSTYNAFFPLYGTHHKFYGAMDYFYANAVAYGAGLHDIQLGVTFAPTDKLALKANGHYFMRGYKIEGLKQGLGTEVDLQLDYELMKDVKLCVGYSTMFGTEVLQSMRGGNYKSWQDWAFVSLSINPRILSLKW
jgi:hypothetical protein